jgi:hypothetical protein
MLLWEVARVPEDGVRPVGETKMEFVLMKLVGQSIRPGSIFGILDKDNPGQLPPPPGGYWSDHGAMTEQNFPFAAEAKQAIAKSGYSLVGTDAIETIGHAPVT